MIRLIPLILLSLMLTGCGILGDFFADDAGEEMASDRPPTLTLVLDEAIDMHQGTYCWTNADMGLCADMIPPTYEADDHIAVTGTSLTLHFANTPPTSLSAYVHPGSNLMTRIADIQLEATLNPDGTVTIPLTEQLQGDYVLVVFAQWQGDSPTGDSMYSLPITVQ